MKNKKFLLWKKQMVATKWLQGAFGLGRKKKERKK